MNVGHIRPVVLVIGREHESRLGDAESESESYTAFKGNNIKLYILANYPDVSLYNAYVYQKSHCIP